MSDICPHFITTILRYLIENTTLPCVDERKDVFSQGERAKFDRFGDTNVRDAQRRVYLDLRIYRY